MKFNRFFVACTSLRSPDLARRDMLYDTTWSRGTKLPASSLFVDVDRNLRQTRVFFLREKFHADHNSSLPVAPVGTCKLWADPCPPRPLSSLSSDTIFLIVDDECVEAGRAIRAAARYTDVLAARGARRKRKRTSLVMKPIMPRTAR